MTESERRLGRVMFEPWREYGDPLVGLYFHWRQPGGAIHTMGLVLARIREGWYLIGQVSNDGTEYARRLMRLEELAEFPFYANFKEMRAYCSDRFQERYREMSEDEREDMERRKCWFG